MKLLSLSLALLHIAHCTTDIHITVRQSTSDNSAQYIPSIGSPGFYHGLSNSAVTFDQHSLLLDGNRIMFFSGEFHPFRLPSPELWKDVLQKFKAAGFNGVSVYWHWGLSAPNPKEVRFTQHNDLAKFYQVAQEVGILVIVRPGPYVNAETAGGGIPGWVTNIAGLARTNATDYKEAWTPYIHEFAKETAPYQYPDGPVIAIQSENEYETTAAVHIKGLNEHMQAIMDTLRQGGIDKIPLIHNDRGPNGQYALKGLGKVDLYGWDGYPLGFDCDNPSQWGELSTQSDASHQRWNPAEPLALFEWQGGAFSYWSGPGYSECYKLINEQFANVYYKNNYAAGATLQNLYMTYGGTNWGNMHTHTIYSSYDYGAAIREDRTLTPKLDELKLQAYFLHASPDYLVVGRIGNGTVGHGTAYSDSPEIYTTHLNSPTTEANFYVVRQTSNQNTADVNFQLRVNTTSQGQVTIPKSGSLTLAGRESKIIVTNYPFGSSKLVYSTAEVMTWTKFDGIDTIICYALEGQSIEVAVEADRTSKIKVLGSQSVQAQFTDDTVVSIHGSPSGLSIVTIGHTRIIVADKKSASAFWAPRLSNTSLYDMSPNIPSILVHGPYLVRSATLLSSGTLALTGDLNQTTVIDVFAPSRVKFITWNGERLPISPGNIGSFRVTASMPKGLDNLVIPVLKSLKWSCADSLPELESGFDDSSWTIANKTTTLRPQKPFFGKNVLYAGEYGFHAGQWVWRGHFTGNATGVQLAIQGGFSFGYSVFLNSNFLGSGQGSSHSQSGVDILQPIFNFTSNQLSLDGHNVLTIIHDSTGMNQDYNIDDEFKTPRGLRGYKLLSLDGELDFSEWRLAGNIGGENAPDKFRGPYNEGGWWFERVGAHLPGYDTKTSARWSAACSPDQGIERAGVQVYRATFNLDLPKGSDVPLAFDFALDQVNPHRVLLFVNGWQFGRFLSSLGPQTSFPIPEGILDHHGQNEILISLWALDKQGAKLTSLELTTRATLSSSKDAKVESVNAPGWRELRNGMKIV